MGWRYIQTKYSAVILLGMNINEDLRFGFSYDMPTISVSNSGTFEFMLGYSFKIDYNKVVKGFKKSKIPLKIVIFVAFSILIITFSGDFVA